MNELTGRIVSEDDSDQNVMWRYKTYLIKLDMLRRDGNDDSPAADKIRDEMDPLWQAMSFKDRNEVCIYSQGVLDAQAGRPL